MNDDLPGMPTFHADEANRILEVALNLAHERGDWYNLDFAHLAARCELSVNEVRPHYADSNAVANAWFARAMDAMLGNDDDIETLPVTVRLEVIMRRWFDSLAPIDRSPLRWP